MTNLTIRMDAKEKERLMAWAALRGKNATDYIKGLVAADMAGGSPKDRAVAWLHENRVALTAEAEQIQRTGIPGSNLTLNYPTDAEV